MHLYSHIEKKSILRVEKDKKSAHTDFFFYCLVKYQCQWPISSHHFPPSLDNNKMGGNYYIYHYISLIFSLCTICNT